MVAEIDEAIEDRSQKLFKNIHMNKFSKPKPNDWHLKLLQKPEEVHPEISESKKQALREEYGFD